MKRETMRNKIQPALGKALAAGLALVCLACLLGPAAYAAPGQAVLTVKQICPADTSFIYRLTPALASSPMPAGSGPEGFPFAITGTDSKAISVAFTQAGVYAYTLGPATACACALEPYALKIYVEDSLKASVVVLKPDGTKAADIQFEHTCGAPPAPPPPTTVPAPPATKPPAAGGPKTGDESQPALYIALFSGAGVLLLACLLYLLLANRRGKRKAA